MIIQQIELFEKTLPQYIYATDELGHLKKIPKTYAVKKKFIQPNSEYDLRWLVYDVDRETASFDWYDRNCPPPNIVATNPENGHAHLFYGLETPVWQQYEDTKAYRFACAVDVALTKALDADPGYAKLIAKNPLRDDKWLVQTFQPYSYDLNWIADYVDLDPYKDRRKNLPEIGLGRNCTLFERLRHWAYQNIRQNWIDYDFWHYTVECQARKYNDFPEPLPDCEIRATAKSVAKWTWDHMSQESFRRWGENRRNRSIAVRREKSLELKKIIIELAKQNPHATQRELSKMAGVPLMTVNRLLKS